MQAVGLRAAGARVRIACERGYVRFFLRTGWPARRVTMREAETLSSVQDGLIVDHGMCIPRADAVFVHSLLTEAARHVRRADWADEIAREAAFFAKLRAHTPIVANSRRIKAALIEHFGLTDERIIVHYPGFRSDRFTADATTRLRHSARRMLHIDTAAPLVGFVTSGDFQTRGLDIFLACAEEIRRVRLDARFLVVGSKRLPPWARSHPLVTSGAALHRPKSGRPEPWFAALDVFLYAARFEAFGMVVAEAQAMGIPVLTSRRVGAAECLPEEYAPWLVEEPEAALLAEKALALLDDEVARRRLAAAGIRSVASYDDRHYVDATVATILGQKR
jgi:glycosyltransferase involved in cell wall biosynthesis